MATIVIGRTSMVDDDGSGQTGTVINNAWKQEFYNQIDQALAGVQALPVPWPAWANIAFNAANHTTVGGTAWTVTAGNQQTLIYVLLGKTCFLQFFWNGFSITGTPSALRYALPAGVSAANHGRNMIQVISPGVASAVGMAQVAPGAPTFLDLYRDSAATAWTAGAAGGAIGEIFFQIT